MSVMTLRRGLRIHPEWYGASPRTGLCGAVRVLVGFERFEVALRAR
jgi:hypothetical protein